MKHLLLLPVILLTPPAMAQEEPSWEAKKAAFMQAYSPAPVPLPAARPDVRNEVDEQADLNMEDLKKFARRANYKTDICARHHMRRVTTHRGWRCK